MINIEEVRLILGLKMSNSTKLIEMNLTKNPHTPHKELQFTKGIISRACHQCL